MRVPSKSKIAAIFFVFINKSKFEVPGLQFYFFKYLLRDMYYHHHNNPPSEPG